MTKKKHLKKLVKPFDKTEIYIRSAFRRIWRWSRARRVCLESKSCWICDKKGKLFADHKSAVVPVEGLKIVNNHIDWNQFYERLFYGALQPLCLSCHAKKTKEETKQRREYKQKHGKKIESH